MRDLYDRARQSWGGATIDLIAGGTVPDGIDMYAVAVTSAYGDTLKIPEDASYEQFVSAYDQARAAFRNAGWLGIFHDDNDKTIHFDAVTVTTREGVDYLYSTGIYPVDGGAYHFATGKGYWPQRSMK